MKIKDIVTYNGQRHQIVNFWYGRNEHNQFEIKAVDLKNRDNLIIEYVDINKVTI